ncbi:MAG: threonylcarbamoyl-AMP synthase [Thaumarchaeota archaeon]|nr:threonylcarbamoyl-AMP synthase [Nitrososphaerota archaeon]
MRTVKCNPEGLEEATSVAKGGGLLIYPTDTVYGVGCDPFNSKTISKIIEAKERDLKPLPILCSSMEAASKLVILDELAERIAKRFWPGPLTIVAPLRDFKIPKEVTAGATSLGVRVPNFGCTLRLLDSSGGYLVGTSANKSGEPAARVLREVNKDLADSVDIGLDGGRTLLGKESTVIRVAEGEVKLLRQGFWRLEQVLGLSL